MAFVGVPGEAPTAIASDQDDTGDQEKGEGEHDHLEYHRLFRQVLLVGLQEGLIWTERKTRNT